MEMENKNWQGKQVHMYNEIWEGARLAAEPAVCVDFLIDSPPKN